MNTNINYKCTFQLDLALQLDLAFLLRISPFNELWKAVWPWQQEVSTDESDRKYIKE